MTEASCPQDCGLPKFFRLKKKVRCNGMTKQLRALCGATRFSNQRIEKLLGLF